MKIRQLHLKRYGHFTDYFLDFNNSQCNFHIICDNNETGKTTSQNALKDLLFGIPDRTNYAFLHEDNMSLSAILENSKGIIRHFVRIKSRQNDLLDGDTSQVISAHELLSFIGPLTKDLLSNLFALSYQTLRDGSAEIAKMNEWTHILFASSSTLPGLNGLIETIQMEEDEIYKQHHRARKPKLNEALQKYGEIKKEYRQYRNQGKDDKIEKEIKKCEERYKLCEEEIESLRIDLKMKERYLLTKPLLGRLDKIKEELNETEPLPQLREDLRNFWSGLQNEYQHQRKLIDTMQQEIAAIDVKMNNFRLNDEEKLLLEFQNDIFRLWKESDLILSFQKDCNALRHKIKTNEVLLERCSQELNFFEQWPIDAEKLPKDSFLKDALSLCTRGKKLKNTLDNYQHDLDLAEQKLQCLENDLSLLPEFTDFTSLELALNTCKEDGNLDKSLREIELELFKAKQSLQHLQQSQDIWQGPIEDLAPVTFPRNEILHEFEREFQSLNNESKDLIRSLEDYEQELNELVLQLKVEPKLWPSLEELQQTRQRRNENWIQLKSCLASKSYTQASELMASCERQLYEADQIADDRFKHAHEVAERDQKERKKGLLEERKNSIHQKMEILQQRKQFLQEKWQATWSELTSKPASPIEMIEWVKHAKEMIKSYQTVCTLEQKALATRQQIQRNIQMFIEAIKLVGLSMRSLSSGDYRLVLEEANGLLNKLKKNQQIRKDKENEIQWMSLQNQELNEKLVREQNSFQEWVQEWQKSMEMLCQPIDMGVEGGSVVIEKFQELKKLYHSLADLHQELVEKEKKIVCFEEKIQRLFVSLHLTTENPTEIGILILVKNKLDETIKKETHWKNASREHEDKILRFKQEQRKLEVLTGQKDALFQQSAVLSDDEMNLLVNRFEKQSRLLQEQDNTLNDIMHHNPGYSIEELISEINLHTHDEIKAKIEYLEEQVKAALAQKEKISNEIITQQILLKQSEESDDLFRLNLQRESLKSEIMKFADEAILRRGAVCLLQKAIERHRQRSQGEQLQRAACLFQRLTCHKYVNLIIEDEKGKQVLKAQKYSGQLVSPKEMSDGTCDQLYLALRLAALEEYAGRAEPIPFIADDLLVNFDDQRSYAALEVLGEFSNSIQVIFFTHHPHLIEIASQCLGKDRFSVQTLSK